MVSRIGWLCVLGACGVAPHSIDDPSPTVVEDSRLELGTNYHVSVVARDVTRARRDLVAARELCHELEARLSEWREDSDVARLNRRAGHETVPVDERLRRLVAGALHVAASTEGAFDPTWVPLGAAWAEAARAGREPDAARIDAALADVGWRHVRLDADGLRFLRPGVRLGLEGVAKGMIVDALFALLRERGYESVSVNIGGDLRVAGLLPDGEIRRIQVVDPFEPTRIAQTVAVGDVAVATSGNYFRGTRVGTRRVGHILDPRTGRPPEFDGSVTVLTRDAAMADALATACFVMGPEAGLELARATPGLDVVYVTRAGVRSTLE